MAKDALVLHENRCQPIKYLMLTIPLKKKVVLQAIGGKEQTQKWWRPPFYQIKSVLFHSHQQPQLTLNKNKKIFFCAFLALYFTTTIAISTTLEYLNKQPISKTNLRKKQMFILVHNIFFDFVTYYKT